MIGSAQKALLTTFFCSVLAACVTPAQISTNKAANYTSEPKRIFVVTDIGSDYGKPYATAFQYKFAAIVKECGAASQFFYVSGLELDESKPEAQMNAFHPDSALSIRRSGGTKDQYGNVVVQMYDARLTDMKTNKVVWRASMTFSAKSGEIVSSIMHTTFDRGEDLAMDMTNKMKDDQIFRSCPKYASIKDTPSSIPVQTTAPIATSASTIQRPAVSDTTVKSSIDLPDGWAVKTVTDALKAKNFNFYASNQSYGATLLMSDKKRAEVSDVQKYAENLRSAQMNLLADGKQSEIETLKINDASAWRFTVQGVSKSSGKDLTWLITIMANDNKISTLNVYAPTDHFSDNRDAFGKLAYLVH